MTSASPSGPRAASQLVSGSLLGLLLLTGAGVGWRQVWWQISLESWQKAGVTIDWRPRAPWWDRWWSNWPTLRRAVSPAVPQGLSWKPTEDRVRGRELELALRCPTVTELEIPLGLLRNRDWLLWGREASLETLILIGGSPGADDPTTDESRVRELTVDDVKALSQLPRLRQLCCRDLVLRRGSLEGLACRLSLESLELQFCAIPDEEWSGLRGATRLRRLELTGQTLPDTEWGRLQRDLPHVRIADD